MTPVKPIGYHRDGRPIWPIAGGTNVFAITARAYRWYADGTETGATALAAENTALSTDDAAILVLRYGVQESGAGTAQGATTDDYQLQYKLNAGAFTDVTTSSAVCRGYTSANLTDAAATTQRLSSGTGAFVAGEIAETDGLLTDWRLTADNFSELLYAVQLQAGDLVAGDAVTFRVLRNGSVFDTYSVTPTVNIANAVDAPAGHAAISGTAYVPAIAVGVNAGNAAATGAAGAPTAAVGANAGHAAATGAASAATISKVDGVGNASATGAASPATIALTTSAGAATATAAAYAATVATGIDAPAGHAAATAGANAATAALGANPGQAAATGTAYAATAAVGANAGSAAATGAANAAVAAFGANAEAATAIAAAYNPSIAAAIAAGLASASAAAHDATVATSGGTNAAAGLASAVASAYDATVTSSLLGPTKGHRRRRVPPLPPLAPDDEWDRIIAFLL